jgi:hypothetical protein
MAGRRARLVALAMAWSVALATASHATYCEPPTTVTAPALAATTLDAVPDDATLERLGAVIGAIEVHVGNVFDTADEREQHRLYRLADKLHRTTSPGVIERQLPFRTGDPYSVRVVAEGERILRENKYLYSASIHPVRFDGRRVDLAVEVRDTWTLKAGGSFGRAGGANKYKLQLEDVNLLGTGKELDLEQRSDVDRTTQLLRYVDPAILGSHVQAALDFANTSDGHQRTLSIGRPFYALDTRWALGVHGNDAELVDHLYALGHVVGSFEHQSRLVDVGGGISSGLRRSWTTRWTAGFTLQEERFAAVPGEIDGSLVPPDRDLAAPWVAWDRIEDRYRIEQNLDQLGRTEDLALGEQWHARLGFSSTAFGGSRNEALVETTESGGRRTSPRVTWLWETHVSGRWGKGGVEDGLAGGSLRYFHRDFGDQLFYSSFALDEARNLSDGHQLLLGGEEGLRGYPLRYQDGDQRVLFTMEQRWFFPWYPFRLLRLGAAAFGDVGRAGRGGLAPDLGWLEDAGVGLRLSSTRSGLGNITHLDVAFPFGGDRSIDHLQLVVSTRETF